MVCEAHTKTFFFVGPFFVMSQREPKSLRPVTQNKIRCFSCQTLFDSFFTCQQSIKVSVSAGAKIPPADCKQWANGRALEFLNDLSLINQTLSWLLFQQSPAKPKSQKMCLTLSDLLGDCNLAFDAFLHSVGALCRGKGSKC